MILNDRPMVVVVIEVSQHMHMAPLRHDDGHLFVYDSIVRRDDEDSVDKVQVTIFSYHHIDRRHYYERSKRMRMRM